MKKRKNEAPRRLARGTAALAIAIAITGFAADRAPLAQAADIDAPVSVGETRHDGGDASGTIVSVGQGDALQRVDIGLNKSLVIDLPEDASDILVANPGVADAVSRSSRRIYLFGKSVGETNIFVFGENGQPIANIDLRVERDIGTLETDLERFIPGSDIEVEIVNDNIVLSGTVLTAQDANRAQQLASAFLNGGEQGSRGQEAVASEEDVDLGVDQSSQIINLVTILGEDQVTLKLTIAEVQRSVMKQLGVTAGGSITTSALDSDILSGLTARSFAGGTFRSGQGLVTGDRQFILGGQIGPDDFNVQVNAVIRALNDAGVMRTLAEPTLSAVSGEEAQFRVGGDFVIVEDVDVNDDGATIGQRTVEYGVSLAFRPVVLSSGRISVKLRTEVAEPTAVGSQPVANTTVLSLRRREAETTVELPSGGSMMIAGLIRDDVRQTISKTPGLSNVPILGALFRSRAFVQEETELVIIATPYLVRPVPRAALARPDDNFHATNDTKGYLLGRVNRIYGNRRKPEGDYHGAVGFIYK